MRVNVLRNFLTFSAAFVFAVELASLVYRSTLPQPEPGDLAFLTFVSHFFGAMVIVSFCLWGAWNLKAGKVLNAHNILYLLKTVTVLLVASSLYLLLSTIKAAMPYLPEVDMAPFAKEMIWDQFSWSVYSLAEVAFLVFAIFQVKQKIRAADFQDNVQ